METHGALQADDCLKESGASVFEIVTRQLEELSGQAKVRDATGVEIPRLREPSSSAREVLRLDSENHPLLSKRRIPRSEVVLLHFSRELGENDRMKNMENQIWSFSFE
jgi:hypothetical protein